MKMTRTGLQRFTAAASSTVQDIWSETVTIAGTTYIAAVAPASIRGEITEGGEVLRSEISVRIMKTALPTRPATGTKLIWNGKAYQIENPSAGNQNDPAHYLQCAEWNS